MTYEEFVDLVMSMRSAQRAYFHNRTMDNLKNAKALERSVDLAALTFLEDLATAPAQVPLPLDNNPDGDGVYHGYW